MKNKPVIVVGFPIICKLIHAEDVILEKVILIPDDQLFNEHYKNINVKKVIETMRGGKEEG